MEPGKGSVGRRPEHVDPKDVDLHETNSSELSASTAGTSLPVVVLSDEEKAKRLEEKKERKEERKKKREARQKKKEAQ
jgi:hypothetical protein